MVQHCDWPDGMKKETGTYFWFMDLLSTSEDMSISQNSSPKRDGGSLSWNSEVTGKAVEKRGHTDKWVRYFEDIQAAMSTVGRPMAIVGHSMGGLITLWSMMHPLTPQVRCVVLSNPLTGLFTPAPKIKVLFGKIASKIIPSLSIPNELNTQHISRDPEVVERYMNDPFVYAKITTRWADQMLKAMDSVQ